MQQSKVDARTLQQYNLTVIHWIRLAHNNAEFLSPGVWMKPKLNDSKAPKERDVWKISHVDSVMPFMSQREVNTACPEMM